ncbi:MAG: kinase/pyrophosphorylase, partial [Gammaproteobacteria bacterium]|nr:kinase/pyrophosphorylase [Gammaproteobacteria bacterium]
PLREYRGKLFGLTISAERLTAIRKERRANSRYASVDQCRREVAEVERLFEQYDIPYIDTTDVSIEEISTRILATTGIERHFR